VPSNHSVEALLEKLTIDEKIGLLHQYAPAVPRLGLSAFRTGTEALHGVSWLGEATVFPQAVGLGATWDEDLLTRVGRAVGTEVRAKHAADPTVSLNVWAPVVNPLRHPFWGRNEEGLSEDATMSGRLGAALARGLRGDHPTVWLTVPTLKHFLGYSNETQRDATSSQLRPRILHEEELPAFLRPLTEGVAGAVMLSYNLVNGIPAHVSPLVAEHLRGASTDPTDEATDEATDDARLFIVSDAAAPSNLFRTQGFPDGARAFATALGAGVDSFTDDGEDGEPTRRYLREALESGLISVEQLNRAVRRQLVLRERTGEFTPHEDPYSGIAADELATPAHVALAREAAVKGVVVLANPAGALPLQPPSEDGTVAVLGELGGRVLTDWYSGTPVTTVSLAHALRERFGDRARADPGNDIVRLRLTQAGHDHDGLDLGEFELGDWGQGISTLRSCETGLFLTRGPGSTVTPSAARVGGWVVQESFRLVRTATGGVQLLHLGSGRFLQVRRGSGALVTQDEGDVTPATFTLNTTSAGLGRAQQLAAQASATVVVVGNDPHLNGRETLDRTTLALPAGQRELVRAARAACPGPVVLVIVSSYPYALDGLEDEVDAVVWSSHGGEQVGEALAAVLLGEAEPFGRLPQTWFASDDDLPDVLEYDAISARATYAYSPAVPLYPLGHGLSYTSVNYGTPSLIGTPESDDLVIVVPVHNGGGRAANELVQVYVTASEHPAEFPRRRLAGAVRVRIGPGAVAQARLRVPRRSLEVWDVVRSGWWLASARYHVLVGRSAEDIRAEIPVEVVGDPPAVRRLSGFAVVAGTFDSHQGAALVQGVEGVAVTGRSPSAPFRVVYERCELDGATALEVTVSDSKAGSGWIEVSRRGESGAWLWIGRASVSPGAQRQVVVLALPWEPVVGSQPAPTALDAYAQPPALDADPPPIAVVARPAQPVAIALRLGPGLTLAAFRFR
jgi:beta-glucosidase